MASGEGRIGSSTRLLCGSDHEAGAIEGVETQTPSSSEIRIVLFGKTGTGKSASGNAILGRKEFVTKTSSKSKTKKCVKRPGEVAGRRVAVVDTPGLYDTKMSEEEVKREIAKCISFSTPGPHAFLLVLQLGRFTEEEKKAVEIIKMIFGGEATNHIIILFTHGDDLEEGETIEEYVDEAEGDLRKLLMECGFRYHAFNNREKNDRTQVTKLIEKIEAMVTANNNPFYTSDMLQQVNKKIEERVIEIMKEKKKQIDLEIEELKQKNQKERQERMRQIEEEIQDEEERETRKTALLLEYEEKQQRECTAALTRYKQRAREEAENSNSVLQYIFRLLKRETWDRIIAAVSSSSRPDHEAGAIEGVETQTPSSSEIRIVLFGRTGTGKSASGNTILGRKEFESTVRSKSETKECVKRTGEVAGRRVVVVDTLGFCDTEMSQKEVILDAAQCITASALGPHAFLLVIQLGRFTEEEKKAVEIIKMIFGGEATNYMIILFTRVDDLEEGETIEKYVDEAEGDLEKLLMECGFRNHAFNNREKNDRTQVTKLIEKIEAMVTANNNPFYTSDMLQQVNKKIEERVIQIMKKKKKQIDLEIEELKQKNQKELQERMRQIEEEIQDEEERETRKTALLLEYKEKQQREYTAALTRYKQRAREEAENPNSVLQYIIRLVKEIWDRIIAAVRSAAAAVVGGTAGESFRDFAQKVLLPKLTGL
ncbi:calponin homology domain-containing protein DDB_G0272472-like [Polyodon spathula]|uniref:calponin homology domain-containing protein DDB_G0272472-like n=1 Tax=Polyodon spathula TaxID=7913 RepID=UPI001B7E97E7|nr:calponin homology domain-containing protein DDB_G0272472-like [Polyodon spathula]